MNQKVINTSLSISKPCGVEVKLQVKIVITNPLPLVILLRTLNCLVLWRIHRQHFFVESPTSTNTSGFEHSVEVRTDAKSESGLVDGFLSMNISPGRDPYTVFHVFSRLMTCQRVITLFLQRLAFYYVDDVRIQTSEHL